MTFTEQHLRLLEKLQSDGGAIVSSGDCSEMEIAEAQCMFRWAVTEDGFGFVLRTPEWLALNKRRELAYPNTDGRFDK